MELEQETKKSSISEFKKIACSYDGLILEKLGFSSVGAKGIQQSCPIHKGDNSAAFSYDRSKCCWSCFTHKCHDKFGNDIIGLVRAIKDCSFYEAVDWIEKVIFDPEISAGYVPSEKIIEDVKENKAINDESLHNLIHKFDSIKDRGFAEKTLKHFGAGETGADIKIQHRRLMIPIRNIDGGLIGFTGRSIYPKCERTSAYHPEWANQDAKYSAIFSKWRHYPKGLNKSIELYNIHEAKKYIEKVGFAVVVEGPFDLWRLWEFGVKNCVASFGCSISNKQVSILKSVGAKCIALAFDSDEPGQNGFKKARVLFGNELVQKIFLPNDKDPGALTINDYNCVIKPQLSVLRKRHENQNNSNHW